MDSEPRPTYHVRPCGGNTSAYGAYRDDIAPNSFGHCAATGYNITAVLERLFRGFVAPEGNGHIAPGRVAIDPQDVIGDLLVPWGESLGSPREPL